MTNKLKNKISVGAGGALTLTALITGISGGAAHAATTPFPTSGAEVVKNCQTFNQPIYEVDSPSTNKVYYTTDKNDAKSKTTGDFTQYKGIAFYASANAGANLSPIHKLYNATNNDYLYVKEGKELTSATTKYGYVDQGIMFYTSTTANDCNVPLQRSMYKGGHNYTYSSTTYNNNVANGWAGEGTQYYVNPKPAAFSQQLYTDYTPAIAAYNSETDAQKKLADYQIAITPTATWVSGPSDNARLQGVINKAKALGQTPQITLYGIPGRDCGSYSSGGVSDKAAYNAWVSQVSSIIGDTPAVLIVEPDAISYCSWADDDQRKIDRQDMLKNVGSTFATNNPNTATYLHIGSGQLSQYGAYQAVKNLDFDNFTGFAMGVSSLGGTNREETWGEQFVQTLNKYGIVNKHYVVDTSRNGVDKPDNLPGASFLSCDNPNAALGSRPSIHTSADHDDAWVWVKHPGVSDGECNIGGLPAGSWDGAYALSLVSNAVKAGSLNIIQPVG